MNRSFIPPSEETIYRVLKDYPDTRKRNELSIADVVMIYKRAWDPKQIQKDIAKDFGIAPFRVSCIKNGHTWSNITKHIEIEPTD